VRAVVFKLVLCYAEIAYMHAVTMALS